MKILSIATAVAISTASLSISAKDLDQVGVADNAINVTQSASGSQSAVIGTAIEGNFSNQAPIGLGSSRAVTGTGSKITGTVNAVTGTGSKITGTVNAVTGTGSKITGTVNAVTGTGSKITGTI